MVVSNRPVTVRTHIFAALIAWGSWPVLERWRSTGWHRAIALNAGLQRSGTDQTRMARILGLWVSGPRSISVARLYKAVQADSAAVGRRSRHELRSLQRHRRSCSGGGVDRIQAAVR